jgi:hypothetical protein
VGSPDRDRFLLYTRGFLAANDMVELPVMVSFCKRLNLEVATAHVEKIGMGV